MQTLRLSACAPKLVPRVLSTWTRGSEPGDLPFDEQSTDKPRFTDTRLIRTPR